MALSNEMSQNNALGWKYAYDLRDNGLIFYLERLTPRHVFQSRPAQSLQQLGQNRRGLLALQNLVRHRKY